MKIVKHRDTGKCSPYEVELFKNLTLFLQYFVELQLKHKIILATVVDVV